jgi:broad specificity phosphatase PhoE
MGSLFLVRHATTAASRTGRNLGRRADPGLTAGGQRLAVRTGTAVAAELAALGHDELRVITSPALRSRQTASAIAAAIRAARIERDRGLHELDYGDWDGLTATECLARDPQLRARWERNPYRTRAPGGESGRDVAARAFPVLDSIEAWLQADPGRAAVVVSHNHVLRLRLTLLLGLPRRSYRDRVRTDPAAYSLVTFGAARTVVRRLNVQAP